MKFSIRDLLLVTVIVAILVAWWQDRSRLADEVRKLRPDPELTVLDGPPPYWEPPNSSAPAPNPPKP